MLLYFVNKNETTKIEGGGGVEDRERGREMFKQASLLTDFEK
jgi:hypothetical protein